MPEKTPQKSKPQILLKLLENDKVQTFKGADGFMYVTFPIITKTNLHHETWKIKSARFRDWASLIYMSATGSTIGRTSLDEATDMLAAMASIKDSKEKDVFIRSGHTNGNLYIDLCNSKWEMIEIRKDGWSVLSSVNAPVKFTRGKDMKPLPCPQENGSIDDLKPFVNVKGEQWFLLVSWMMCTFNDRGSFPLLVFQGAQGSAKSTHTQLLRRLIDPHKTLIKAPFSREEDLMSAAAANWILAFDNLSGLRPAHSDALCRIATGGGIGKRAMYEDIEEFTFYGKRPVILNGIDDIATRADLADRSLVINLPMIDKKERRDEGTLWGAFDKVQGSIFGGMCDLLSESIQLREHIQLEEYPRMADFALLGESVCRALGQDDGYFMKAFNANQRYMQGLNIERSPFLSGMIALAQKEITFKGNASDILEKIRDEHTPDNEAWDKKLFPTSRKFRSWVERHKVTLLDNGVSVTEHSKNRKWTVEYADDEEASDLLGF